MAKKSKLNMLFKNIRYLCKHNLKDLNKHNEALNSQHKTFGNIGIVSTMLDNLSYEALDELNSCNIKIPKVKNRFETLARLVNSNCSLSRFGDGEFMLLHGESIHFQEYDPNLSLKLKEILLSEDNNILVGLADFLGSLSQYTDSNRIYWREYLATARNKIYQFIDFEKQYYDACVTRPYINYLDKSSTAQFYADFKKIWSGQDVVIIEGTKTRMGVGNNLLCDAKSIKRIIAPALNAYSKYSELLSIASKLPKSSLFLISLGPTATVLAYDLAKLGFRALDSGHLDVEYEWFLSGTEERTKIAGKYVWEAGGINVNDTSDHTYLNQIIADVSAQS